MMKLTTIFVALIASNVMAAVDFNKLKQVLPTSTAVTQSVPYQTARAIDQEIVGNLLPI